MGSNRAAHETETSSPSNDRDTHQSVDVTRRRFIATSAAGVAGLGALGSAGSAAAASGEHTLVIEGFDSQTSYSFTVGNNLEKSTAEGATIDDNDEIIDQSAHGQVWEGKDAYTFDGPLYSFDFDRSGEINVTLDGEPARVGNRPDHTLVIEGFGPVTSYSFSTSGRAKHSDAYGATVNKAEKINDYGVTGAVQNGKDAFTYDGELLSFDFDRDGEVRVTIDGKAAHVGQRPDRTITVVAKGRYAEYRVGFEGTIREVIDAESGQDGINEDKFEGLPDEDGDQTFDGAVSGTGYDRFTIDGDVTNTVHHNDNAPAIYSNYRQIL
ncbi:pre-peptidase [Halococcus salifodinae]